LNAAPVPAPPVVEVKKKEPIKPPGPPVIQKMLCKLIQMPVPSNCGMTLICEFSAGHKANHYVRAPLTRDQWIAQLVGINNPTLMFTGRKNQSLCNNLSQEALAKFLESEGCEVQKIGSKIYDVWVCHLGDLFWEIYKKDAAFENTYIERVYCIKKLSSF
jgi:hypothetical protein